MSMIVFEVTSNREISENFARFEKSLEDASLKVVTAYKDYTGNSMFIVVGTLMKSEEDFTVEIASRCFGKNFISQHLCA